MTEKLYGNTAVSVNILEKVELAARRSIDEFIVNPARQMERFAEELQKIIVEARREYR